MPTKSAAYSDYIETDTGNKISRRALISGTQHIVLAGKSVIQHDVVLRGDLVRPQSASPPKSASDPNKIHNAVAIHLGKYVFVSAHCTLHPPSRLGSTASSLSSASVQQVTYYPLRIGDFVTIGPYTHIQAAKIGNHVSIGANCSVGSFCIINDNVRVEDGTVLPASSVWASGSVVAGRPARVVGELGEGWGGVEGGPGAEERERWANAGNKK